MPLLLDFHYLYKMRLSFVTIALLSLGASSEAFAFSQQCTVTAEGDGKDDAPALLAAVAKCGKGGSIVLPSKNYTIAQPITMHLEHASLELHGYLSFTPDITYWVANSYRCPFQNQSIAWWVVLFQPCGQCSWPHDQACDRK